MKVSTKLQKAIENNSVFKQYSEQRDKLQKQLRGKQATKVEVHQVQKKENGKLVTDRKGNPVMETVKKTVKYYPNEADELKSQELKRIKAKVLKIDRVSIQKLNGLAKALTLYLLDCSTVRQNPEKPKPPSHNWKNYEVEYMPRTFEFSLLQNSKLFSLICENKDAVRIQNKQKQINKYKQKKPQKAKNPESGSNEKTNIQLKPCILADADAFRRKVAQHYQNFIKLNDAYAQLSTDHGEVLLKLKNLAKAKGNNKNNGNDNDEVKHEVNEEVDELTNDDIHLKAQIQNLERQLHEKAFQTTVQEYQEQLNPSDQKFLNGIITIYYTMEDLFEEKASPEFFSFVKNTIRQEKSNKGKIQAKLKNMIARIVEEVCMQLPSKFEIYLEGAKTNQIKPHEWDKIVKLWLNPSLSDNIDSSFDEFIQQFNTEWKHKQSEKENKRKWRKEQAKARNNQNVGGKKPKHLPVTAGDEPPTSFTSAK